MIEQAAFSCDALESCAIVGVAGEEAMGALPRWTVDVVCPDGAVELDSLVGQGARLALGDDGGGTRSIPLHVAKASYRGYSPDGHRYRVEASSRLFPLLHRSGSRIFQKKTSQQIIAELLEEAGIPSSEIDWRLAGRYGERIYCVQYQETEWSFVRRLLEDDGINLWFEENDDDEPTVVFGDDTTSHSAIRGNQRVRFSDPSAQSHASTAIHSVELRHSLTHDAVYLRDFDVRQPDRLIEGSAGEGAFEYYEYPANVQNEEAANARAASRLEQLQRLSVRATGRSGNARLQPGRVITVEGASDDLFNTDFLIVSVTHELRQAAPGAPGGQPYANRVLMVPFDPERVFRPEPPREVPRVEGVESAIVTGPAGEEIHVDDLGCIKIRFPWDRSGITDDKSSRWVRCLQLSMLGSMVLPRMGWEVPVAYIDGNPDLPFVLGRLYNAGAPVPYGQPGAKATSTIQSGTSPADGTTQEIRLADDAGKQEAFVHATKDQTVVVGGSHTITVSADETHDVAKSFALTIEGSQTITIGGDQTIVVGEDYGTKVKGGRSESIGGAEFIKVTGNYNCESAGAYDEVIGGFYGLQCNQSNTVIQGSFTQLVGGPMVLIAGLGTNNSCAAARMEKVGGARSVTAATSVADSVMGVKSITAGSCSETAGIDVVTNVGGVGSIKVGGSASFTAGGPVAVEAPRIKVKAGGSITAKGGPSLELSGGAKPSGKTKFDAGKTHKKSKNKVG